MTRQAWRQVQAGMAALMLVAGLVAAPAGAAPMRLSLDGLDDPGPVSAVPAGSAPARFVTAAQKPPAQPVQPGRRPDAQEREAERAFVPTQALPQVDTGADLVLPPPDDAGGAARLLDGAGAVAVAPPQVERRLGEFAPPPPAAEAAAIDSPPPGAEVLPELPLVDLDALRQQRLAIMVIVVPMVLAAIAVWWWVDRGRRHLRRPRRGTRARAG